VGRDIRGEPEGQWTEWSWRKEEIAKKLQQINARIIMLKSTFSGLQRGRWQYGSIFIRLAVVASQVCETPWHCPKFVFIAVERHLRSSMSY